MATGLETMLFGGLVDGRECGDCVMCCRDLSIRSPELVKPAYVLCPHCTGAGCGIYETRPSVCRSWHCLWRWLGTLPEELRPDRCGVMFDLDRVRPPTNVFEHVFISAETDDKANFQRPEVQQALQMFIRHGQFPVWLRVRDDRRLVYPAGPLVDAILNIDAPPPGTDPALIGQARRWLDGYLPYADMLAKHEAEHPPEGV